MSDAQQSATAFMDILRSLIKEGSPPIGWPNIALHARVIGQIIHTSKGMIEIVFRKGGWCISVAPHLNFCPADIPITEKLAILISHHLIEIENEAKSKSKSKPIGV